VNTTARRSGRRTAVVPWAGRRAWRPSQADSIQCGASSTPRALQAVAWITVLGVITCAQGPSIPSSQTAKWARAKQIIEVLENEMDLPHHDTLWGPKLGLGCLSKWLCVALSGGSPLATFPTSFEGADLGRALGNTTTLNGLSKVKVDLQKLCAGTGDAGGGGSGDSRSWSLISILLHESEHVWTHQVGACERWARDPQRCPPGSSPRFCEILGIIWAKTVDEERAYRFQAEFIINLFGFRRQRGQSLPPCWDVAAIIEDALAGLNRQKDIALSRGRATIQQALEAQQITAGEALGLQTELEQRHAAMCDEVDRLIALWEWFTDQYC
jgi:hypothetical protein